MPDVGGVTPPVETAAAAAAAVVDEETRRRLALEDRLRTRDARRQSALEAKRVAREETSAEDETVGFFASRFNADAEAVAADIADADVVVDASLLPAHLERVGEAIQKLTKYLADSKLFLPTYDLRKSQEKIDGLNDALAKARNDKMPKKKFGFKNKNKSTAATTMKSAAATATTTTSAISADGKPPETTTTKEEAEDDGNNRDEGDCVIKDFVGRRLGGVGRVDLDRRVVGLFRLDDCRVLLRGSPSAVHARHLRGCRVFVGPTSGSVFVDRCVDCVFVLACQQLRIHSTKDTSFYIHVTSKAIVEDCSSVAFAPYNLDYPGLDADYVTSGLDRSRNNWRDVDDFNFLATEAASPNWRLLRDDERTRAWSDDVEELMMEQGAEEKKGLNGVGGGEEKGLNGVGGGEEKGLNGEGGGDGGS